MRFRPRFRAFSFGTAVALSADVMKRSVIAVVFSLVACGDPPMEEVTDAGGFEDSGAEPTTPGIESSLDLIEKARANGELDEESALLFQVYAVFRDPRLPEVYRGDDAELGNTHALSEAADRFDSFSEETQEIL